MTDYEQECEPYSRGGVVKSKRVGRIICKLDGNRVFEQKRYEWALAYSDKKSWYEEGPLSQGKDLHLEIESSELERIGLSANSSGEISLLQEDSRLVRGLKTTGKYALSVGVPLVAALLIADYLFDEKIQMYITKNLPRLLEGYPVDLREHFEQSIRNNPEEHIHPFNFFRVCYYGVGLFLGGLGSFLSSTIVGDNKRMKIPELKKVKRILRKHAKHV